MTAKGSEPVPKKSLGQHWLTDEVVLGRIADAADIQHDDTVLEVGPGLGTLTTILCERAEMVVAVEFDELLARELPERVQATNLQVEQADILDFNLDTLPQGYKVVANIPYYLTSHLIRRLLEQANQPARIVLLIQKEVAERVVAEPGQMSLLSVAAQFYADCSLGDVVEAALFDPPPKVDSQVVVLQPHATPDVDVHAFFRVVKAGFSERRKKLANSLAGGLAIEKSVASAMLNDLQFNENVRAQELSIEQWLALYERVTRG